MFPFMYLAPFPKLYISLSPLCLVLSHSIFQCRANHFTLCKWEDLPSVVTAPLCCRIRGLRRCVVHPHMAWSPAHSCKKRIWWEVTCSSLCSSLSGFFIPRKEKKKKKKNVEIAWAFVSCQVRIAARERVPACTSALSTSFTFPDGASALVAVNPVFPQIVRHILFPRQDVWNDHLLLSFKTGEYYYSWAL